VSKPEIDQKYRNLRFKNGLEEIPFKNSGHDECDEIYCLSAASLDFNAANSLNFRNLFTALGFLLRFWAKPKMKSPSGSRT